MPIIFRCEHCQQRMSISRKLGGKTTTCPRCGQSTYIPPEEEVSEVSEPVSPSSEPDNTEPAETPEDSIPEVSAAPSSRSAAEPRLAPPETEDTPAEDIEFQLGKRSSDDEEMDLTPMVDV
ncbi:MAG: hypothetical protein KDA78_20100, partial [Planctomycetaceae bacterium]|nr:hypothetical protein [Planctomycetaceae bacterium]